MAALSVNKMAWQIAQKLIDNPEFYGVNVSKSTAGATIIDAGVNAAGGFHAGKKLTEICMGGAGKAQIGFKTYGNITFPSITISMDHPAIAALGSQFAGWRIKDGDQIAIGSGPVRALALKPKDVFEEIGYKDQSDKAVLTFRKQHIANRCAHRKSNHRQQRRPGKPNYYSGSDCKHRWFNSGYWQNR